MRAWQWTATGRPPALDELDVPDAEGDAVLLRVLAAGMCHTDVGAIDEPTWASSIGFAPITLGHEIAGRVVAVGPRATDWRVGDRVAVHPKGATVPGFTRHGGYAQYHLAPASDLVRIPDGVPDAHAAIATDAGMTSHHAVVTAAGASAGSRVGIIGIGGLGQFGAQIAVAVGAQVYAADPNPRAREDASGWGLEGVVASADELEGLDLDAVVDFAGFGSTALSAVRSIKVGGTVVMVGMGAEDTVLKTREVIHRHAIIRGSQAGTPDDIRNVMRMLDEGVVVPRTEVVDFEQVPAAIERLRVGRVTGRLVMHPHGES